jgi:hypothetical protein
VARFALKRFVMALSFAPACLPLPRSGAPLGAPEGGHERAVATLPQRRPAETPLALGAAGFPGLTLDGERAWVGRAAAERLIDRVGMAYLRDERAAGAPPPEQLVAVAEQLRLAEHGRPRAIKAEILGPVSLALQATDDHERPLAYDPALREALAQHLALRAEWVRDLIESSGAGALVALDEPFLDALGSPFCPLDWDEGGDLLARTLEDIGGNGGICVAGEPRWDAVLSLPADVIFFDAYEHSAGLVQAAGAAAAYLERGGALGWGVVPADPAGLTQERAETLARRVISSIEYLAAAAGVAPALVAARSLISSGGGLAQLTQQQAARAATLCAEVSAAARAHFGLE